MKNKKSDEKEDEAKVRLLIIMKKVKTTFIKKGYKKDTFKKQIKIRASF
jgi:hypothetical protein